MRSINAFLMAFWLGFATVLASIAATGFGLNGYAGAAFAEVFVGPVAGVAAMVAYDRLTHREFGPTNGKIR